MTDVAARRWRGSSGARAPGRAGRGARRIALACLALLVALPHPTAAQTLVGRVLDESSDGPVGGAIVSLVGRNGAERARTLTDSVGGFTLAPPEAGEYFLVAERFGYTRTRSPLLALGAEGEASIDLMVTPEPIGLEGLEVSVEEAAAAELQAFGLSPRDLGNRWIDRREIEAIPLKRDMGTIIERITVPGTRIVRPENLTPGSDDIGLCVSLQRSRAASGSNRCALIILNGVPVRGPQALHLDPDAIESMAILTPTEAIVYYGTMGGAGAVLVWTRRGG